MNESADKEQKKLYWNMYRALVGVTTLCGLIIVLVYQFASPIIKVKKNTALEKAIFSIFPNASSKKTYSLNEDGKLIKSESVDDADKLYATYDDKQQLIGFAIPARGMGYQDNIHLLYAYDPFLERVTGLVISESRETPGLGNRIEHDVAFLKNFEQLDVTLNETQSDLKNPLVVVNPGKKKYPWQIDSITGATVSSNAVGKIMQQSTQYRLPALKKQLEEFKFDH